MIGSTLKQEEKSELFNLLKEHKDVFAWSYQNMLGIEPDMVQHFILLHLDTKPVKQKLRRTQSGWMLKIKEGIPR